MNDNHFRKYIDILNESQYNVESNDLLNKLEAIYGEDVINDFDSIKLQTERNKWQFNPTKRMHGGITYYDVFINDSMIGEYETPGIMHLIGKMEPAESNFNEELTPINPRDIPPAPETDPLDLVTFDVPLLIRLFEFMHEEVESDEDLHHIATNILNLSKATNGPLQMEHYQQILNPSE